MTTVDNPLYFCISIPFNRWVQFLRTKKPGHSYDSGNGSIDYGEFITYEGIAESARAKEIMAAISFRFSHYKDTDPYNFHFAEKSTELNWDFDFPVDEPVIVRSPAHICKDAH